MKKYKITWKEYCIYSSVETLPEDCEPSEWIDDMLNAGELSTSNLEDYEAEIVQMDEIKEEGAE